MCFPSDCKVHSSSLQEFLSLQIRPASSRPCQCTTTAKVPPDGFGTEEMSTVSTECLRKPSFAVLSGFDMDRQMEEEHGATTVHTQEKFRTDKRHHTIIVTDY